MDWEMILDVKLETLGSNPSKGQEQELLDWVLHNVPSAYWRAVADSYRVCNYEEFQYDLYERCAESGF